MSRALLQLTFFWFNVSLTLPVTWLMLGLPLILHQQGWSGQQLGLFQLAALPAVIKLWLALPVERGRLFRQRYKSWGSLLWLGLALLFALLSQFDLQQNKSLLFALLLCCSLLLAWCDVPVNALAIALFHDGEQARAGSVRAAALFTGAVGGSGIMLLLWQHYGWALPCLLMSAAALLCALLLRLLPEPPAGEYRRSEMLGFFRQPGGKGWYPLCILAFPFLGSGWLWLKPLLLDAGLPMQQVIMWVGVGGSVTGALVSLIGARWLNRGNASTALPGWLLFAGIALLLLAAGVSQKLSAELLLAISTLMACAIGGLSALMFMLMMAFSREENRAVDYGIQASLFTLSRLSVPLFSGLLLDRFGGGVMLTTLALCTLAVALYAWLQRRTIAARLVQS
ncbi:MFS transporter [Erwinia sp. S43]|uniref:MFS transporter n=1 Tax=unclassified Erwinia TaxID=2622719 RepID=UPI00190D0B94|nr:MFS transporter [Erwinia sp. INIA01]MBK0030818.1 MFS transporter [Erwinia sp. S43]MCW1876447.1 MFS transporter [Erwinia sp. INIA01]